MKPDNTPMPKFVRVGSTDICVKCILITGQAFCACPPEDKFFFSISADEVVHLCGCVSKCTKNHSEFF